MERTNATEVQALADTGATLTVIPENIARELELGEFGREMVKTGAGKIDLKRSSARISIDGKEVDPLTGELKEEMLLLYELKSEGGRPQVRGKFLSKKQWPKKRK